MNATATLDARDLTIIAARRKAVLLKMQLLSDAPTGRPTSDNAPPALKRQRKTPTQIPGVKGKSSSTSSAPPGVNFSELDRRQGPPPKHQSLYAHYVYHFTMAQGDAARTRSLCDCAEADYDEYAGGGRRHQGPVYEYENGKRVLVAGETTEMRSKRILRDYVGWTAERVAHMEGITASAIRKLRTRSGYDAVTGESPDTDGSSGNEG